VKTFKVKEMVLIHTRRCLGHKKGLVFHLWIGTDKARTWNMIIINSSE